MKTFTVAGLLLLLGSLTLFAANGKGSDVSNNTGLPEGKPFQSIGMQLSTLEERIVTIEIDIAALETELALLKEQVEANDGDIASLKMRIDAMELECESLKAMLALKQGIINAECPDGMAVHAINSDGSIACESIGGGSGGALKSTKVFSWGIAPERVTVLCPSGYEVSGGGYTKEASVVIEDNYPLFHGTGWRVRGSGSGLFMVYGVCLKAE